jgi:hypothetical protein
MQRTISVAMACLALGACAPVDRGFGETVRANNIRQTVNPEGQVASADGPMEGGSGVKADTAVDRYERGVVAAPAAQSSTSINVGGTSK